MIPVPTVVMAFINGVGFVLVKNRLQINVLMFNMKQCFTNDTEECAIYCLNYLLKKL